MSRMHRQNWFLRPKTLALLALLGGTAVLPQSLFGQTIRNVPGTQITLQFWDSGTNVNRESDTNGSTTQERSTRNWTQQERDAIERAVRYWDDVIGNNAGRQITIDLFRDGERRTRDTGNDAWGSWDERPTSASNPTVTPNNNIDRTAVQRVWADGINVQQGNNADQNSWDNNIDSSINFNGTFLTNEIGSMQEQMGYVLEASMIHEFAHSLGYTGPGNNTWGRGGPNANLHVYETFIEDNAGNAVAAGGTFTTGTPFFFDGPNASAVFGDVANGGTALRVPLNTRTNQTSHLGIFPFSMSHEPYRNYLFFSEVELAVLQDLGYTINRSDFFGRSIYRDAGNGDPQIDNTTGFNSNMTYGIGLHVAHADDHDILQNANLTASGAKGTGIRIDGDDNMLTIAPGTAIAANGDWGTGVVVSYGERNVIVHRGTINANSTTADALGTGIFLGFGRDRLGRASHTSNTLGDYLVDRLDITGSISAGNGAGDVIRIHETAAVEQINIMAGANLSGHIRSDALTDSGNNLDRPILSFGRMADAAGAATSAHDVNFVFNYNGNMSGVDSAHADLDLNFFGGQTTLGGTINVEDVDVRNNATAIFNGNTTLDDVDIHSGTFRTTNTTSAEDVTLDSGRVEIAGGTTTADTYTQNGGTTDVDGTLTVDQTFDMVAGTTEVANGGNLNANRFDMQDGATNVAAGGQMTVATTTRVRDGEFTANGTVASNTFLVDAPGRVQGTGEIQADVVVDGTIAPGNNGIGTLTATGNYASGTTAVYDIDAAPGGGATPVPGTHVDQVDVSGTAQVDGGVVNIDGAAGTYEVGGIYRFLTSGGGLTLVAAPTFTENIAQRRVIGYFDANDLGFKMLRDVPFASLGNTPNQVSFGTYFDQVKLNPLADLQVIRNELDCLLDEDDVRAAMDQLTGDIYGSLSRVGIQNTGDAMWRLSQQLEQFDCCLCDCSGCECGTQNEGWVSGYGLGGNAESDGNASALDYDANGTHFGAARWVGCGQRIGFFGNSGRSHATSSTPMQSVDVDSLLLGGFLHGYDSYGYYLVAAAAGFDQYESSRRINFGGINRAAKGDFDGRQATLYLERGADLWLNNLRVRPKASLQYAYFHQEQLTETGAGAANLTVAALDEYSLRSHLGAHVSWDTCTANGISVSPEFHAAWRHEFLDASSTVVSGLNVASPPTFAVRGLDIGRDWAFLGGGITVVPQHNVSLRLGYDAQLNSQQVFHTGSGSISVRW